MSKIVSSTLCLFFFLYSAAQSVHLPLAGMYSRLGAYSLKRADAFSFGANQAALAQVPSVTAGVFGERRFLMEALSYYQLGIALPTSSGHFGLRGSYSGSEAYNQSQVGLAYGRKLGEQVDVGIQFNYHHLAVSGYGGASAVSFEAGVLLHVSPELHLGLYAGNPTSAKMGKSGEEQLPALYSVGVGYEVSEQFFVAVEVLKVEGEAVDVHAGMQYSFEDKLFASCGFTSHTSSYYLGVGVVLHRLRLDAAATVHPQLGVTPGLAVIFGGRQKQGSRKSEP